MQVQFVVTPHPGHGPSCQAGTQRVFSDRLASLEFGTRPQKPPEHPQRHIMAFSSPLGRAAVAAAVALAAPVAGQDAGFYGLSAGAPVRGLHSQPAAGFSISRRRACPPEGCAAAAARRWSGRCAADLPPHPFSCVQRARHTNAARKHPIVSLRPATYKMEAKRGACSAGRQSTSRASRRISPSTRALFHCKYTRNP